MRCVVFQIFDRLCCSFGQIIFDSLFLVLTSRSDVEKLNAVPPSSEVNTTKKPKTSNTTDNVDSESKKTSEKDEVEIKKQKKQFPRLMPPNSIFFRIGYFTIALVYVRILIKSCLSQLNSFISMSPD
jgi:hypothetical protein